MYAENRKLVALGVTFFKLVSLYLLMILELIVLKSELVKHN